MLLMCLIRCRFTAHYLYGNLLNSCMTKIRNLVACALVQQSGYFREDRRRARATKRKRHL